jgi:hypothetical protein
MSSKKFTFFNFFHRFFNLNSGQLAAKGVHFMQKPNRTLLSNSGLFQGFCSLKSAKNDLKMGCQNVKLFLREP